MPMGHGPQLLPASDAAPLEVPLAAPLPPLAAPVPASLAVVEPEDAPLVLAPLDEPLVDGKPPSGAAIASIEASIGSVTGVDVAAPGGGGAVMTWSPFVLVVTCDGLAQ